jgi:hypothetical protein
MSENFEITVCSDIDYEDLIAEVSVDGGVIAVISQERGAGDFDIELIATPARRLRLAMVEEAIERAKERLTTMRR